MPIAVKCPNPACGKVGQVAERLLNRVGRCPQCRTKFKFESSRAPAADARATLLPGIAAETLQQAAAPDLAHSSSTASARAPLEIPAQVGRFEIRARLGAGAFGAVYHAYDGPLEREVALKVPRPEVLDRPERIERFLREARAAAQLRHPHIVPVFDAGQAEGIYYIASAYIAGQSLAETVRRQPLEPQRAARIVRDLTEAVAYAHRQGVVHRDIKPANVMLDTADAPHLLDFGLAARRDDADKLTHDGAILGTPSYMAPEQARGQSGEALPPSDQYSLGVVLYELLTGGTPFSGPPALVLFHALNTEPPSPRSRNAAVPLDLETICLKAMAKRIEDRYADCQALADDLRRWLEGEPIAARPLSVWERATRWLRREPILAGLVLVTAVCLLVVAVIATGSTALLLRTQQNIAADRKAADVKAHEAEAQEKEATQSAADAEQQAAIQDEESKKALAQANKADLAKAAAEAKAAETREKLKATEEQESRTIKQLYETQMELARRAVQKNDRDRARYWLDQQRADLRDEEWHKLDEQLKKAAKP